MHMLTLHVMPNDTLSDLLMKTSVDEGRMQFLGLYYIFLSTLATLVFYSRGYTSGTWNGSAKKELRNFGSSSFSVSLNNERKICLFG